MRTFPSIGHTQHPVTHSLNASALALVLAATVSFPVFAADSTSTGAPGANGVPGKNGSAGKGGAVNLISHDLNNSAIATAGNGGNGGVSSPKAAAGNGAKGGEAKSVLTLKGQNYVSDEGFVRIYGTVTATGGNGGNGGLGPVLGNGGAGGLANAKSLDYGSSVMGDFYPDVLTQTTVNGVGGNGGAGKNGGAGGGSTTSNAEFTEFPSTQDTTSRGGTGGNGLNQGGNGGNAVAAITSNKTYAETHGASALAIGGNGGDSAIGLNGNGGKATATVQAPLAVGIRGDYDPIYTTAKAVGGNSGVGTVASPGQPSGNGGDAFATAASHILVGRDSGDKFLAATAQGGNGTSRGGNAVATAINIAENYGNATSVATGGGGKIAGAAVATSTVDSYGTDAIAAATAKFAGPFVKQVVTTASITTVNDDPEFPTLPYHETLYAQSRVGDTTNLVATTPQPVGTKYQEVKAAAPTAQEAAQFLAGNSQIQTTFTAGEVWGIGEFKTGRDIYGGIATASYVFDTKTAAHNGDLWLGLLDATIAPHSSQNSFGFNVTSGNTTLFSRHFSATDFLTYFDDNPIDLGAWKSLVGSDGLFKLDISFAGSTSGLDFAFGNAPAASAKAAALESSVPEPSALVLVCAGLLGLMISRKKSSATCLAS
ncbi:MAG: hypothetical protein JWM78_2054 [Verrucomicrobiaceae bacterium]|nr:hypothetical protein [Verrucomicrobiaceae bacterium]